MKLDRAGKPPFLEITNRWFKISGNTSFKRYGKGYASSNWIFRHRGARYILKEFSDFKTRRGVVYEYRITNYISGSGFPYEIPILLPAKDGKPFVEQEGKLYSLYRYISGRAGVKIGIGDAMEIGMLVAKLHNAIEGYAPRACFKRRGHHDPTRIRKRLKASRSRAASRNDSISQVYMECSSWFLPVLDKIDLGYYYGLKAFPAHEDIAPGNILWRNGRIAALIDFGNIGRYRSPFIQDTAFAAYSCCLDGTGDSRLRIALFKNFFMGYNSIRRISANDAKTMLHIIVLAAADNMEFLYFVGSRSIKRVNRGDLTSKVKVSKWLLKNNRILTALMVGKA